MVWFFPISEYKTFELQLEWFETNWSWFDIGIDWSKKTDHAGFRFNFGITNFYFHLWICDNRHWNIAMKRWYRPEEFEKIIQDEIDEDLKEI